MWPKQELSYFILAFFSSSSLACLQHSQRKATALDIQDQAYTRRAPLASTKTAINKVRVFDGQCFTGPQTVVFANGRITSDTKNIETHRGTRKYHVLRRDDGTQHGVWRLRSLFRAKEPQPDGSRLGSLGRNSSRGNSSGNGALQPPPDQLVYPDTDLPQLVAYAFGNGSDYYKLVAKPASLSQAQQNTLVSAAHGLGRQTMTHASDLVSLQQAVASRSDGLQHIPDDGLLPISTVAAIKKNKQFVTPTMTIFKYGYSNPAVLAFLGRTNSTNATYAHVEENVRRLHEAGVPLLAGTDAVGAVAPGIDLPFGSTLHEELQLLSGVGLTPVEALRAGTVESAAWHRLLDRGEIKIGKRADLVLLNSNPLLDISNTRDIAKVWVGGVEVQDVVRLT
ncbi:hypothetical protein O1611_g2163 [Lasiodiplodia mahajangana]|uniref:Uncharacterized protein n=1 Tax=Lasiodiplodia mahajangana TaxID=1108764 RepID=A0ACC2JVB4_9PEZI|nr:hypothetical protein O1611_g2163 [Lasiodiplodia mahajangana]